MTRGRGILTVDAFLNDRHGEEFGHGSTASGTRHIRRRDTCETYLGYVRSYQERGHSDLPRLLSATQPELSSSIRFFRNLRNAADYDRHLSSKTIRLNLADALTRSREIIVRLDEVTEATTPR